MNVKPGREQWMDHAFEVEYAKYACAPSNLSLHILSQVDLLRVHLRHRASSEAALCPELLT